MPSGGSSDDKSKPSRLQVYGRHPNRRPKFTLPSFSRSRSRSKARNESKVTSSDDEDDNAATPQQPPPPLNLAAPAIHVEHKKLPHHETPTDITMSSNLTPPPQPPPRPPRSQREATMTVEPSPDNVDLLMAMGYDRDIAVRYLRAKRDDITQAVNALMDGEDISQAEQESVWVEDHFAGGREGDTAGSGGGGDQHLRPLGVTAPNTRANSPAGGSRASLHPSSRAQEDADLQAAMANSQHDLGLAFEQEGGVIRNDGTETSKYFGPATRDHYESTSWAMVPSAARLDANEVIPDVEADQRKNVLGEPRFVKHVPNGDYMPGFITICHEIAGLREAMLMRGKVRDDYGKDADWWRGHAIAMPRVVQIENGTPAEYLPRADGGQDELVTELQRLMAFLDASERSYVGPGALLQTDVIKEFRPSDVKSGTLVEYFMRAWMTEATGLDLHGDVSELFTSTVFSQDPDRSDEFERVLLDLPVLASEGENVDLAELLDGFFWGQDTADMTTPTDFVNAPAEVLVMRLSQQDKSADQLRADVPAIFYMDKYLRENVDAASQTRRTIAQGKQRLAKIDEVERKLSRWPHPTKPGESIDAQLLLKHSYGHLAGSHEGGVAADNASVNMPDASESSPQQTQNLQMAQHLGKIMTDIDAKLAQLATERDKARKALAQMSKNPLPALENQLKYRYTLRGVITKPNITYILRPSDDDSDDEGFGRDDNVDDEELLLPPTTTTTDNDADGTPDGMQWWRIEYEVHPSGSGAHITKTKTPDYDVLRAVELEHCEALLVYASDEANDVDQTISELPPPLAHFVEADNRLFRDELMEAASRTAPPAYDFGAAGGDADIVQPSIEERIPMGIAGGWSTARRDSMDSTRVNDDSDDDMGRVGNEADAHRLPSYGSQGFMGRPDFGLGPDLKQGFVEAVDEDVGRTGGGEGDEEVVHEIRLDEGDDGGEGMEMVEKKRDGDGDVRMRSEW